MSFFYSIRPDDVQHDHEIYELSPMYRLIVQEGTESGTGDVFFNTSLFESTVRCAAHLAGQEAPGREREAMCIGTGSGDTASASLIDLLLDLAANDAKIAADAAAQLDKIAQEAARLVVLYMTELPLYEDSLTIDPRKEAH
jgi:hypothetical protein